MSFAGFCESDDYCDDNLHAALRYDEIASSGAPARPIEFPAPTVYRCEQVDIQARDHKSGTIHSLRNVIIRSENNKYGRRADTAYLVTKKIGKSVYGTIRLCIVLKRCEPSGEEARQDASLDGELVEWESTDRKAVIKASEWSKIHALRGRHLEDPIREISAMQLLGNYETNVVGSLEVLQDDSYLYTVMPYLPGGGLLGRVRNACPESNDKEWSDNSARGMDENQARKYFRQLLLVSLSCQLFRSRSQYQDSNPNCSTLLVGNLPFAEERRMSQRYFVGE